MCARAVFEMFSQMVEARSSIRKMNKYWIVLSNSRSTLFYSQNENITVCAQFLKNTKDILKIWIDKTSKRSVFGSPQAENFQVLKARKHSKSTFFFGPPQAEIFYFPPISRTPGGEIFFSPPFLGTQGGKLIFHSPPIWGGEKRTPDYPLPRFG